MPKLFSQFHQRIEMDTCSKDLPNFTMMIIIHAQEHRLISDCVWNKLQRKLDSSNSGFLDMPVKESDGKASVWRTCPPYTGFTDKYIRNSAKNPKLLLKVLLESSNELVQLNTVEIQYNVPEIFMEDGEN